MDNSVENHYEILGISPDASDEEVKQTFRDLAKHYHPDRNPGDLEAERRFKLVNTAYEGLKDESRRRSYDQWLAFSAGKRKTRQVQWGRLAAIVLLLFIGPSAVLFGVMMSGGTSIFKGPEDQPNVALTTQTEADPIKSLVETTSRDEDKKTPEAANNEEATDVKPADRSFREKKLADASGKVFPARDSASRTTASADIARLSRESPISLPPQLTPRRAATELPSNTVSTEPTRSPDKKSDEQGEPPSSDVTQIIPQKPVPQSSDGSEVALSDKTGSQPEPSNDTPRSLNENKAADSGGAPTPAQILALLKESGGVPAPSEAKPPATPRQEWEQTARLKPDNSLPDTFSDCDLCPLMSVTKRPDYVHDQTNLAVSLSEITVAQWNLCVNDGVCSPYQGANREPSTPVIGLGQTNVRVYAEWLSKVTGEQYTIVMPLSTSETEKENSGGKDCHKIDPVPVGRLKLSDWDWLKDEPNRECERSRANRNTNNGNGTLGFRVGRQIHKDG